MTAPSISQLNFYTNKRLTDKDWSKNFTQIVEWLTNGYDLTASSLTVTGNITAGGRVTAGAGFYGDGSNLTGVGGGGSAAGVGISQIEQLTETSKNFRTKLPASLTNVISEPLIDGANFTGTLTAGVSQGVTTITITPTITGQEPPKLMALTLVKTSTGDSEDIYITGGASGTYTISPGIQLSGGYPISSPIYRNFCSINQSSANASILSGQNGVASKVQSHIGGQIDAGARTNATIDWSIRMNSLTQGLQVNSVVASPTNTINLLMSTDRTGEFSSTAPYNKIILCKVTEDGQKNLYQIGKGKEFTITNVGAFASTYAPITVSDTYNDMDTENSVATGGVTAAGITAISSDSLTYWVACAKTAIPKLSFVPTATSESFVEVVPKKATVFNQGMAYPVYVHSYWPLNESSSGNALNIKTPANLLTQVGTVNVTVGKLGLGRTGWSTSNFLAFDSGGSSATIYDKDFFVVEAWFKTSGAGSIQNIIGKYNQGTGTTGWQLGVDTNNKVRYQFAATTVNSSGTVNDGQWHYIVMAQLGTGASDRRFYLDGALVSATTGASFSKAAQSLFVGAQGNGNGGIIATGDAFNASGVIDSVAFWSTAPASGATTEMDGYVSQRYAGGRGREYGSQFGLYISGTESNKTGQLATLRADICQASITATLPTLESKNLIVSGGL